MSSSSKDTLLSNSKSFRPGSSRSKEILTRSRRHGFSIPTAALTSQGTQMRKLLCTVVVLVCLDVAAEDVPSSRADDMLRKSPATLSGGWTFVNDAGAKYDGPFSVTTMPDGAGTLTFVGRRCQARSEPMKWTSDGKTLTMKASLGQCGDSTFVMQRGTTHSLEGTFEAPLNPNRGEGRVYLNSSK
jgi:hypothetical protein